MERTELREQDVSEDFPDLFSGPDIRLVSGRSHPLRSIFAQLAVEKFGDGHICWLYKFSCLHLPDSFCQRRFRFFLRPEPGKPLLFAFSCHWITSKIENYATCFLASAPDHALFLIPFLFLTTRSRRRLCRGFQLRSVSFAAGSKSRFAGTSSILLLAAEIFLNFCVPTAGDGSNVAFFCLSTPDESIPTGDEMSSRHAVVLNWEKKKRPFF